MACRRVGLEWARTCDKKRKAITWGSSNYVDCGERRDTFHSLVQSPSLRHSVRPASAPLKQTRTGELVYVSQGEVGLIFLTTHRSRSKF